MGIVVSLILVLSIYLGVYYIADVETYINETKDSPHLYDFYDAKKGSNENSVYFIGSSIVGCAIYPSEIESILNQKGYNISVYNLKVEGFSPLERSTEIQKIIDCSPSLVVFGESYATVATNWWTNENIYLVQDRLEIRDDALYLYSNSELTCIETPQSIFGDKRFIFSALKHSNDRSSSFDYFGDAYTTELRISEENNARNYQGIIDEVNDGSWSPKISTEDNRYKDALIYNTRTLQNAGIPVVILNMPLHPLVSEHIDDESRKNFFALLNATGATWYDYEQSYPEEIYWYKDGHHLAPYTGALEFAPVMADIIIQELS